MKVEPANYKKPRSSTTTAGRRGGVAAVQAPPQSHQGGIVLSDLPPPELATLTPNPPSHLNLQSQSYQIHHGQPQQHMIITGVPQQKLIRRGHQIEMLQQAKFLCDEQDFVDLTIYCEDGVVRAHQMLLAVASPFLKSLFQESPLYGLEDICLILPETKACLVQALIHFVYTGTVVSKEDHFYSLMKLVYALSINASIEAESTHERPTDFSAPLVPLHTLERVRRLPHQQMIQQIMPSLSNQQFTHLTLHQQQQQQQQNISAVAASAIAAITQPAMAPPQSKMGRYTSAPPSNILSIPQHTVTTHQVSNNKIPIQLPTQPVPIVNGVTIKNEPHQVPSGSYIAIDPNTGLHYKVEVPNGQMSGDMGSDPLATIMHETIFTETSAGGQTTMYTTENGQVIYTTNATSTVSVPSVMGGGTISHQIDANDLTMNQQQQQQQQQEQQSGSNGKQAQQRGKKRKQNNKENAVVTETVEELPCQPDDEDLNTPYSCAQCNKTIKGRVMLQAHTYQEHYDNPELSRIDIGDKHACRVCLKLFTRNSDVKAHILRVHCGDRRYPCTVCGKRFKESTHLRKHLYTHTGERPHYCTLCDKGFQTSSDLKRHKRTRVHQEKVEQLKVNDQTPPSEQQGEGTSQEYERWEMEAEEEETPGNSQRSPQKQLKTNNVNTTAQQLLTSITQPVSLVSVNGQTIDSIIDMKMLTQSSGSPSAPSAVPVTSSWGPDVNPGHYSLKVMSSGNEVDVNALLQGSTSSTVTSASSSMPNIIDGSTIMTLNHQQQLQLQQALGHQIGRSQHRREQRVYIQGLNGLEAYEKVGGMLRPVMESPRSDDVGDDDESRSNPVA